MGPVCAGGLDCKLTPYRPKDLDNNYIRGYNCTRDTPYRSPRPSRLSPTAQRQAGGTLPKSHPTTQNQLPQPPACPNSSPPCGEVAGEAGRRGQSACPNSSPPCGEVAGEAGRRGQSVGREPPACPNSSPPCGEVAGEAGRRGLSVGREPPACPNSSPPCGEVAGEAGRR